MNFNYYCGQEMVKELNWNTKSWYRKKLYNSKTTCLVVNTTWQLIFCVDNCLICDFLVFSVNVVDGEILYITKVSRLHMATYLCIASNGVPPSVSKRVSLKVQCKYHIILLFITTPSATLLNVITITAKV